MRSLVRLAVSAVLLTPTLVACGDKQPSPEIQSMIERLKAQQAADEAAKPRIDPSVMQPYPYDYFTQGGALDPGWGRSGIDRINKLRVAAAKTAIQSHPCGRVEISDLDEKDSTPPDKPVIFVDCSSHYRFIVTESDVGTSLTGHPMPGLE